MTTSALNETARNPRRFPWVALIFIASTLAIPITYWIVASHSGSNHFGEGLKGSPLLLVFDLAQLFSLIGFTCGPHLSSQSYRRKWMFTVLGTIIFFVDQFLSFLFIAFGMFPD